MQCLLVLLAMAFLAGFPVPLRALPIRLDTCSHGRMMNSKADSEAGLALPDTLVGRQFGAWLKTFNSGDLEAMRRFVAEQWDPETARWMMPLERYFTDLYPDFRR